MAPANLIKLDSLHQTISGHIGHQSEKDYPRGSVRNGILDGTKCQSSERRGNLFRLLCIAHTAEGINALSDAWTSRRITGNRFRSFIMLYLSMEEWMHSDNSKMKVVASGRVVSQVLRSLKTIFPRKSGNGYNIPKYHGMAKIVDYIRLFGSALNFYGGPGESHHKYFVKAPGDNTQRRVAEFAKQISNRIYENMIFEIAKDSLQNQVEEYELVGHAHADTDSCDSETETTHSLENMR